MEGRQVWLVPAHGNPEIATEIPATQEREAPAKEVLPLIVGALVRIEELAGGEGPRAGRMGRRGKPYQHAARNTWAALISSQMTVLEAEFLCMCVSTLG